MTWKLNHKHHPAAGQALHIHSHGAACPTKHIFTSHTHAPPPCCRQGFANPIDLTVAFRPQRDEVFVHLLERQTNFARYLGLYCAKYVPQEERLKGSSWQGEACHESCETPHECVTTCLA